LAVLGAAFTAGLSLTLVIVDSSGSGEPEAQRIVTDDQTDAADDASLFAAEDPATVVALADMGDRTLLRVPGDDDTGAEAAGAVADTTGAGTDTVTTGADPKNSEKRPASSVAELTTIRRSFRRWRRRCK
jgi:hypothetical protein